ncbi:MAG TPA: type II CAAX endopeptidase family protein [Verrucomicrobiae bacterium]|nr:type II CAAX endopeptidase family protein [Verrucomicrobiae bacterium]
MQRTLRQPGFWLACGLMAIGIASQGILAAVLALVDIVWRQAGFGALQLERDPLAEGIINLLALGLAIGVGLLVNRLPPRRAFPFTPIPRPAWGWFVLVVVGAAIVLSEVDNLFRWLLPPPRWVVEMMAEIFLVRGRFGSMFFTIVIVAPVMEELLFRGLILRGLLGRFRPWTAVLMSAMLFGLMHVNPWQMVPTFFLGWVFGWFYLRTGSLWPCVAAHALNNLLFLVVISAPFGLWQPTQAEELAAARFQPWWLDVVGGGVLALGLWQFRRATAALADEGSVHDRPMTAPDLPPVLPT